MATKKKPARPSRERRKGRKTVIAAESAVDGIHTVEPAPHHGMSRAASAPDSFWDVISLMPESAHMLMRVMSNHPIPISFRMMQGFGAHTSWLVDERGRSVFAAFHWKLLQAIHSLVHDEAVMLSEANPHLHPQEVYEAIERSELTPWESGLSVFTEQQGTGFNSDAFDWSLAPVEDKPGTARSGSFPGVVAEDKTLTDPEPPRLGSPVLSLMALSAGHGIRTLRVTVMVEDDGTTPASPLGVRFR